MTCTVDEIVSHIQCQLSDPDGRRYTADKIANWINLGWVMIAGLRPDLFAQTKVVDLVPGTHQNFCEQGGCSRITKINYTVGNECVVPDQKDDDSSETNLNDFMANENCLPTDGGEDNGEYAITTFTMDGEQPCAVMVKPPVPNDGKKYQASVACVECPEPLCSGDELPKELCQKFLPCLISWVMSQAMQLNVSSATSHGRSNDYYQQFFGCMNAIRQADYALEVKDYYLQGPDPQ